MLEITKIDTLSSSEYVWVHAHLSSEWLPGCGYLLITQLKWSYWFFSSFDHLVFDRAIDNVHGFSVSKRRWQAGDVEREWFHQKNCWLPLLDWSDEHAKYTTIHLSRDYLTFIWRRLFDSKTDTKMIADQLYALVDRIRLLR